MKVTIKTSPEIIIFELSEIEDEELQANCELVDLAIRKQSGFNPKSGSLEFEVNSVDDFQAALDELFEAVNAEMEKARKS